jgi:PPM family protein phosphatase
LRSPASGAALVEAVSRTDVDLVRERNEDSVFVGRALFAVADGMGGHVAGDVASATVVEALRAHDATVASADLTTVLGRAIDQAGRAMRRVIEAQPDLAGMGTTLVAMLCSGSMAAVANVGDSRAYRLRDGDLVQITEDHTYAHLVWDAATVPNLPEKIARFMDGRLDGRSPDITLRDLRPGDRYLLCSDGLSSYVPETSLRETLAAGTGPDEAADRLMALALGAGGPDNITMIVIDAEP